MKKLLAMIDGSIYSQSVCAHAAWAASRLGCEVELLHVIGRRATPGAPANFSGNLDAGSREVLLQELVELDAQANKVAQKRARLILAQGKDAVLSGGAGNVSTMLRLGDLPEEATTLTKDAGLSVIGKRGEAADFAKLHLGSNLERVVRASTKPVLIANREFKPISSFLVAFDGQKISAAALAFISQNALFTGLTAHVVMAGDETVANRQSVEGAVATLKAKGIDASGHLIAGQADRVLSSYVQDHSIGLVVMGAYSKSSWRHLFLGATTTETIRACLVPILIYR